MEQLSVAIMTAILVIWLNWTRAHICKIVDPMLVLDGVASFQIPGRRGAPRHVLRYSAVGELGLRWVGLISARDAVLQAVRVGMTLAKANKALT